MRVHQFHNNCPYIAERELELHREAVRRHGRKADACVVVIGVIMFVAAASCAAFGGIR